MTADYRVKYATGNVTPETPTVAGSVVAGWLSAPVCDRSKEFIDGRDMDLADFQRNPVFLWCHDRSRPPLGKVKGLSPRAWGDGGYSGLFGEFEFDPEDEFAQSIYSKFRQGYLRSFSVGFLPSGGWRQMSPDELARIGHDPKDRVSRMVSGKLLEASAVIIPDCPAAVTAMKSLWATVPDAVKPHILAMTPPQSTFAADYAKVRPGFPPAEKQSPALPSSDLSPAPSEVAPMADATAADAVTKETPAAADVTTKAADAPAKAEPQKVDITVTVKQEQPAPAEKAAAAAPEPNAETPAVEKAADEPAETPAEAVEKAEGGKMTPGAMAYHTACCGMKAALADGMAHAEMSDHEGVKKSFGRMAERVCKAAGKGCMKAAGYFPDHAEAFKAMAQEFGQSDAEPDDDEGDGDTPEKKPEPEKSLDVAELVTKAVEEQFAPLATKDEVNALRADIADLKDGFLEFLASQVKR